MPVSLLISGVVASLVGFASTLPLLVAAYHALGASPDQMSSAVFGLCLSIAVGTLWLCLRYRLPIIVAWTAPGGALLAASHGVDIHQAVGAFLLAGLLTVLTAALQPVSMLVRRIPVAIAAAMLAGVLFRFAIALCEAAAAEPALVLPLAVLFLVARRLSPFGAVLVVLGIGVALAFLLGRVAPLPEGLPLPVPGLIWPAFDLQTLIGVGLPLYLVTMASQNLPGFAVLQAAGYTPPTRAILTTVGLASIAAAPLGTLSINLSALTASLCTGPDTHPDPARRWVAGLFFAATFLAFTIGGAAFVALIVALPVSLVATFAGLALFGPLVNALGTALGDPLRLFPAVVTFAVTASGVAFVGIGSAFWGLGAGLAALALERIRAPSRG
ncbi:MAG TPA: benzoate/H(+) symporter BenE family transporter [Xanthobacteraceae bacterium]|nr:benzoate/H(+) symporter BenE family transporter [Xanthobacteraceae bacterium]